MKKPALLITLIVALFVLKPSGANAQRIRPQWDADLSIYTEAQLRDALKKARKLTVTGFTLGTIGGLTAAIGGVIYTSNMVEMQTAHYYNIRIYSKRALAGSYIMGGGLGLAGIALPLIISGYLRKTDVEIALALEKISAKVTLKPDFRYDFNRLTPGLTVGVTF